MDVSIIIVSYNTQQLLRNCIVSIYQKTYELDYEIMVVDNDSHDGSEEMIRLNFPKVQFIQTGANIGFGRANNLGLLKAKGRNILFLNSDTLLINNAIKILSDYIDQNTEVGICGGNLYDDNLNPTHSFKRILPGITHEIDMISMSLFSRLFFGKNLQFNFSNRNLKVGYITGADMMVKKNIINRLGSFDDDFFLYFEEVELTHRIKKAGYKVVSVSDAKIIHLEGASYSNKEGKIKIMNRSRKLYYNKIYKNELLVNLAIFLYKMKSIIFLIRSVFLRNKRKINYWKLNFKTI